MAAGAVPVIDAPWRARMLAMALGVAVGVVGTAFRFGAEGGYAAWSAFARASAPAPVHRLWLAVVGSAALAVAAVGLTRWLAPEAAGSGIQEIEGTLRGSRPPLRWMRVLTVKFFGGLAAIGSGLILGREGPTIHMGGALGAAIAAAAGRTRQHARVMVGAGSAAGLAVAFNAPLGGILFAMEELRREFPMSSGRGQLVLIATITAVLVNVGIAGPSRILPLPIYAPAQMVEMALAVPFAVLVGLYGVLFNAMLVRTLDAARTVMARIGWLPLAGFLGAGIGALLYALPDATGGGEALTVRVLESPLPLTALLALLALRTVVFNLGYSCGTPGGIFAPQLAFGAILGLLFAGALLQLSPDLGLEPGRFAVAGMAALLTATVRAPLTGLALVIEMTGNFALLPMALLASLVADVTADALGSRPIYEVLLERTLASTPSD